MKALTQLLLAGALVVAMGAGGQKGGTVAGRVQLGSAGLGNAVVYLEGVHGTFATPAQRVTINQQNKSFSPHVVACMKGQTVEFLNSDDFLHNTYSQSKTKNFDLHQPGRGSRSLLKTDQTGVIEVRCHIHGNMQAWIVVVDNPFFAVTDARGIFKIDGVPPGSYKIKSWSEENGLLTGEVHVTAEGGRTILKYAGK